MVYVGGGSGGSTLSSVRLVWIIGESYRTGAESRPQHCSAADAAAAAARDGNNIREKGSLNLPSLDIPLLTSSIEVNERGSVNVVDIQDSKCELALVSGKGPPLSIGRALRTRSYAFEPF
ncbi:hypothetical protein V1477_004676 [Vespula maculifrons]|uniref:Uncharacterized protein n=1 Tax=Vespula maculifrons TaxID=7453 RepID=A0ABD2CMH2_VESMC